MRSRLPNAATICGSHAKKCCAKYAAYCAAQPNSGAGITICSSAPPFAEIILIWSSGHLVIGLDDWPSKSLNCVLSLAVSAENNNTNEQMTND